MSFAQLKETFDQTHSSLTKSFENFSWNDRNSYAHWLACTLNYVENSTRILALAAGTFGLDRTLLSNRFIAHAAEEKGHEKLLLSDLKNLQFNLKDLAPTVEMLCYSRSLYYWVSPVNRPVGLIGWVLSLEGLAASSGAKAYKITSEAFGANTASFLNVHAESDISHFQKALDIAKDLNEEELKVVGDALKMYSSQYENILRSIASKTAHKTAA